MPIKSLFYCEFDNLLGPRLLFQAPQGFFSEDDFDAVADYVITKPDLCGRIVTVLHPWLSRAHGPARVVAFPVGMQHEKYTRNTLLYSVGLVVDQHDDTRPFEPVLRKLGNYLHVMESESEFLLRPSSKASLQRLLEAVLTGLKSRGECFVPMDAAHTVALRLLPVLPEPPPIHDYDVPVRLRNLDLLMGGPDEGDGWDLGLRMVVPHIDGVAFVRAIAETADVEVELVSQALTYLLAYGLVAMVDIFQFNNVYATQPKVQMLLRSAELREACLVFVTSPPQTEPALRRAGESSAAFPSASVTSPLLAARGDGSAGSESPSPRSQPQPGSLLPSFYFIFWVLTSFGAGSRVGDVCARLDTARHCISVRRLITFAVMHGLLRRVHKYPVPVAPLVAAPLSATASPAAAAGAATSHRAVERVPPALRTLLAALRFATRAAVASGTGSRDATEVLEEAQRLDALLTRLGPAAAASLFDGTHHLDEICCVLCTSQRVVEEALGTCAEAFTFVLK